MRTRLRRTRLGEALAEDGLDALLATHLPNIRYLSGFSGSAAVLLVEADGTARLVTDARYVTQASEEAPDCELVRVRGSYEETVAGLLGEAAGRRIGYEETRLTVARLRHWEAALAEGAALVPTQDRVERLRIVKDEEEQGRLERAARGLLPVLEDWARLLRPGAVERELAAELDYRLRRAGYEKNAFETIVASGPRSALPHGRPSTRAVERGDLVVVDFGGVLDGYASDVTRTFAVGEPSAEAIRVYEIVREAQAAAIEAIRPGVRAGEVDAAARSVIEEAGYGESFGHGTGHGLGLEVHEAPWVRPGSETVLEPGMVVTVEPGVYLPGRLGVRLEDDVLVGPRGAVLLSREPDALRHFPWVCYRDRL